ncbi:MAG TPA: DUF3570 domain-containing protein [Kofleriaceae bacterium]|nr:DUF3570 domain-containing protein [Kofleriaceae bacterium]
MQLRRFDRIAIRSEARSAISLRRRITISIAAAAIALGVAAGPARADGTLALRGVYYKERATRVMQPMLDGMFEAGERGLVTAHFLVDAITSASASSGAVDTASFTEQRYEAGAGYTHQLSDWKVGGEAKYSSESDYKSFYAGARGELELAQKNTVLGLGGGLGHDTISGGPASGLARLMLQCERDKQETAECGLTTYSMFLSASQIVSRNAVVGVSADLATLRGYMSNPYRSAIVGSGTSIGTLRERHPTERNRTAVAASARYYIRQTHTTLIGAYRFYRDNWQIHAHTPELRAVQEVGSSIDATLGYRFYDQTRKAFFYEERYAMEQPYLSDDVKLSKFTSHTIEARLGILGEAFQLDGRWAGARFEAILQYIVQNNRFGNAVVAHAALTIPFSY